MGLFSDDDRNTRQRMQGTRNYSPSRLTDGHSNLQFNSFSGTDIQCFLFDVEGPGEALKQASASPNISDAQYQSIKERVISGFRVKPFGELQTITVSIANQPGPVRRLGEKEVVEYKMGARTVAGSMIFAMLNRDVFASYMKGTLAGANTNEWRSPNYVDEIPEFNILIQGGNEFGAFGSGMLIGVKLTNFGTTFSVDDLYTEATYNYVARHFIPFTDDWKSALYDDLVDGRKYSPVSMKPDTDYVKMVINYETRLIHRTIYEWWNSLPPVARDRIRNDLPKLQQKIISKQIQDALAPKVNPLL